MIEKKLVSVPCTERFEYRQEIVKRDGEKWTITTSFPGHLSLVIARPWKSAIVVSLTEDSLDALMPEYRDVLSDFLEAVAQMKLQEAA